MKEKSCCKVNMNEVEEVKSTLVTRIYQSALLLLMLLITFPILYFYVIYMVLKQIITGKSNKIGDIATNLKDGLGLLIKDRKDRPEYYSLDNASEEDFELMSLDKEENE